MATGLAVAAGIGLLASAGAPAQPDTIGRVALDERTWPGQQDPDTRDPDPRVVNPGFPPVPDTTGVEPPAVGGDTPPAEQAGPHAAAPTETRRKLATSLVVTHKGLDMRLTAPAGLHTAPAGTTHVGSVEISVGYGGERSTVIYDNVNGTNFLDLARVLSGTPVGGDQQATF